MKKKIFFLCLFIWAVIFLPKNAGAQYSSIQAMTAFDTNKDGIDEIGVLKNEKGKQVFYVYEAPRGERTGRLLAEDAKIIPSGQNIVSIAGMDYNQDGIDEVGVVKDDSGDQNFYLYTSPRFARPIKRLAEDRWEIPYGDNVFALAGLDVNGDKLSEVGVLKRVGSTLRFYLYSIPKTVTKAVKVGQDNWSIPSGNNIIAIAGVDYNGDKKDKLAVIKNEGGNYKLYIYRVEAKIGKSKKVAEYSGIITAGNNIVGIAGGNFDHDPYGELAVMKNENGDYNLYIYDLPGEGKVRQIAVDKHKIPGLTGAVSSAKFTKGKYIDIDISEQKLTIYRDGIPRGRYPISTGKWDMPTPIGTFAIRAKIPYAYSKKYNLYMPWWNEFHPGYGIHELPEWKGGIKEGAGHLGIRVSHGCVRLGVGPAKFVYDWAPIGTPVVVHE